MASHERDTDNMEQEDDAQDAMLDPDDAAEVIADDDDDDDVHMASDSDADPDAEEEEDEDAPLAEIEIQNDSVAHFDAHKGSVFCIAQHPRQAEIVATGGGDDAGYVFDATPPERPLLPASYQSGPPPAERQSLPTLFKLEGHTDSLNAIVFTEPRGEYVVSGGLDGKLRVWRDTTADGSGRAWAFVAEAQEVEEVNFLVTCPHPDYPNTVALGAGDGSIWVYSINADDKASPLTILQALYMHSSSCTAGAWTPDGRLLATVSEDGSLYVWDVFGEAASAGLVQPQGAQTVVGLTPLDERFKVDGGLYSVAVSPNGAFVAVGGADGNIRVVGLPRLGDPAASAKGAGSKAKTTGKSGGGTKGGPSAATSGQAGQILASLKPQTESVETISFAPPPLTMMAAGSVDGSIVLFDTAHRFAVRRHIRDAHEEEAVIKVEFVQVAGTEDIVLTSCGNDGVLRRWTPKGGTAAAAQGMLGEWRGHRGGMGNEDGTDGGGILDFVQRDGRLVITAGDDFISLVYDVMA